MEEPFTKSRRGAHRGSGTPAGTPRPELPLSRLRALGMRLGQSAVPAAGLLGGAALAGFLPRLPVVLLSALGALGIAWGRLEGRVLCWLVLGLLSALLRWQAPARELESLPLDRPVSAVVALEAPWRPEPGGWSAFGRLLSARHRNSVWIGGEDSPIRLFVAGGTRPPEGRLRLRGWLRRSATYRNTETAPPPAPLRLTIKSLLLVEVVADGPGAHRPVRTIASGLRVVRARWRAATSAPSGETKLGRAFAGALLLGDPSLLPERVQAGLRRWGLAHLMAISGLHVGLLAGTVWLGLAFAPVGLRRWTACSLVVAYASILGARPSLARAVLMLCGLMLAQSTTRRPNPLATLCLAAALVVAVSPGAIVELGFQLSFAATLGILLFAAPLASRLRWLPRWLAVALSVTVCAQLATLPWAVLRFHQINPLAPLANLLLVPWTGVLLVTVLGWGALVALGLHPTSTALDLLASPYGRIARLGPYDGIPLTVKGPGDLLPAAVVATLMLAAAVVLVRVARRRPGLRTRAVAARWALGFGLVAAVGSGVVLRARSAGAGTRAAPLWVGAEVVFFDVGQGDATLLRSRGQTILIDGGGWRHGDFGGRVLLPALAELGVRHLDLAILSHGDSDHCRGLLQIGRYLPIRELWLAGSALASRCGSSVAKEQAAHVRVVSAGLVRAVGGWRLRVLHSPGRRSVGIVSSNRGSLIARADAPGISLLLTGDVDREGERALIASLGAAAKPLLDVSLLKVAHHGSRSSSSTGLLQLVAPGIAVVSVGRDNSYGHPADEVLARLRAAGARVLRTDRNGRVRIARRHGATLVEALR